MAGPAWLTERPVAHRGLHDPHDGPAENSLPAFRAAIRHGFAIELDIQLSADGIAMVFHDRALQRMTRAPGLVSERSASELAHLRLPQEGGPIPEI